MRRCIHICIILLAVPSILKITAAAKEVSSTETKKYKLSSEGSIKLYGNDGDIHVTTWDREEVKVRLTKRAWGQDEEEARSNLEEIKVVIRESMDYLIIREEDRRHNRNFNIFDLFDGDFWREQNWRSALVEYELTVPRKASLRIESDEGGVIIKGSGGSITLKLDEGDADLKDITSDDIDAYLDEGDVRLASCHDAHDGFWTIKTDEGRISLDDCRVEHLDADSDEGEIILKRFQGERFRLKTDEGDILADFIPGNAGDYQLESDEGDVEISIPAKADLRFFCTTYEGYIDSDFDLRIKELDDGESLRGEIGSGSGRVTATADEGDIILIRKD